MNYKFLLRRFVLHILSMILIHLIIFMIGLSSLIVLIITSIEVVFLIVDLLYYLVQ